jgi:hypothetical protein
MPELSEGDSFSMEVDLASQLLVLRLRGFWTTENFDSFEAELQRALTTLSNAGIGQGEFDAIVDVRSFPVQSQDAVLRLQAIAEHFGRRTRRIANIMSGTALQQIQAKRVAVDLRSRAFLDEAEARQWIGEDAATADGPSSPKD